MSEERTYSIGELAEAGGVSRWTVRFYVQRKLIPPPDGLGRGARYSAAHLDRLLQIKAWQEQGVPLDEILGRLGAPPETPHGVRDLEALYREIADTPGSAVPRSPLPATPAKPLPSGPSDLVPGQAFLRQLLAPGYELNVGAGRAPLSAQQLAALARHLIEILETGGSNR